MITKPIETKESITWGKTELKGSLPEAQENATGQTPVDLTVRSDWLKKRS